MKDTVPCSSLDPLTEMVVTRTKPKSASMAWGGVESEMRMFGWERDGFVIELFMRVKGLTPLMSPCAVPQLCRYVIPLTTPRSYAVARCRSELTPGADGATKLTSRNRSALVCLSRYSTMFP